MGYDKFSQLEPRDIDKRIWDSNYDFVEMYKSINSLIEKMKDLYYNTGDELGIDPADVESAWNLVIGDLGTDV